MLLGPLVFLKRNYLVVLIVSLVVTLSTSEHVERKSYVCVLCLKTVMKMISLNLTYTSACSSLSACDLVQELSAIPIPSDFSPISQRKICQSINKCPTEPELWELQSSALMSSESSLDVRVTKAYGSKGYNQVRLSVISKEPLISDLLPYSARFQYRWTTNFLNSGLVTVTPGEISTFSLNDQDIRIYTPLEGQGVRGVIIADPCFQSQWSSCEYAEKWNMFSRLTETLNTIFLRNDTAFWGLVGDNFYDLDGFPTEAFFGALSSSVKTATLISIPGNHDFWVAGDPSTWTPDDQLGYGFLQWYAQDTAAAVDGNSPYNFSASPDTSATNLPVVSNFMSYYKIGNVGIIGFSGAHNYR